MRYILFGLLLISLSAKAQQQKFFTVYDTIPSILVMADTALPMSSPVAVKGYKVVSNRTGQIEPNVVVYLNELKDEDYLNVYERSIPKRYLVIYCKELRATHISQSYFYPY